MLVCVKKGGRVKHERKTSTYPDLFYFVAFELTFELELTVDPVFGSLFLSSRGSAKPV